MFCRLCPLILTYHSAQSDKVYIATDKKSTNTWVRGQKEECVNLFVDYLSNVNWDFVYDYGSDTDKSKAEILFNNFFNTYTEVWYSCSPLKVNSTKRTKRVKS